MPVIAFESSMGNSGPFLGLSRDEFVQDLNTSMDFLALALWGCYLVLPGEKVMTNLLQHQKEMMDNRQQEGQPSSSSSSRRFDGEPPVAPGCFWFIHQVPGHVSPCAGLTPEVVVPEEMVTLEQLQLIIHVLLLLWPRCYTGAAASAASTAAAAATGAGGNRMASAGVASGTANITARAAADRGSTGGAGTSAHLPQPAAAATAAAASRPAAAGNVNGGKSAPQAAAAAGGGSSRLPVPAECLPEFGSEESVTFMLLLLAALLQQAPAEINQQLMQEQEGNLLLQLLHRVLMDQQALPALTTVKIQMHLEGVLENIVSEGKHNLLEAACSGLFAHAFPVRLLELVLLVLQSLLFVGDPWEAVTLQGREHLLGMHIGAGKYT